MNIKLTMKVNKKIYIKYKSKLKLHCNIPIKDSNNNNKIEHNEHYFYVSIVSLFFTLFLY